MGQYWTVAYREADCVVRKMDNPQAALLRLLNVLFSAALTPEEKSRILEEEFQIPQRENPSILREILSWQIWTKAILRNGQDRRLSGSEN